MRFLRVSNMVVCICVESCTRSCVRISDKLESFFWHWEGQLSFLGFLFGNVIFIFFLGKKTLIHSRPFQKIMPKAKNSQDSDVYSIEDTSSYEEFSSDDEDSIIALSKLPATKSDKGKKNAGKNSAEKKKTTPSPKQKDTNIGKVDENDKKKETKVNANSALDVILPPSLLTGAGGECTVMIQVDPDDAALLDYEGISGAIGRFEADGQGVVLDLKGLQYSGSILPGPTAMVVGLSKGGQLRVEGITDEFATLQKTKDVMATLDAVVHGEFDEGFKIRDENVNKKKSNENNASTTESLQQTSSQKKASTKKSSSTTAKRKASGTSTATTKKSRKST